MESETRSPQDRLMELVSKADTDADLALPVAREANALVAQALAGPPDPRALIQTWRDVLFGMASGDDQAQVDRARTLLDRSLVKACATLVGGQPHLGRGAAILLAWRGFVDGREGPLMMDPCREVRQRLRRPDGSPPVEPWSRVVWVLTALIPIERLAREDAWDLIEALAPALRGLVTDPGLPPEIRPYLASWIDSIAARLEGPGRVPTPAWAALRNTFHAPGAGNADPGGVAARAIRGSLSALLRADDELPGEASRVALVLDPEKEAAMFPVIDRFVTRVWTSFGLAWGVLLSCSPEREPSAFSEAGHLALDWNRSGVSLLRLLERLQSPSRASVFESKSTYGMGVEAGAALARAIGSGRDEAVPDLIRLVDSWLSAAQVWEGGAISTWRDEVASILPQGSLLREAIGLQVESRERRIGGSWNRAATLLDRVGASASGSGTSHVAAAATDAVALYSTLQAYRFAKRTGRAGDLGPRLARLADRIASHPELREVVVLMRAESALLGRRDEEHASLIEALRGVGESASGSRKRQAARLLQREQLGPEEP
ncbi:MAG: hypothetical protein HUU23_11385 [Caldilineales bacterium]|nr:hypothetical protein [Caldilineales bacterium]